MTTDRLPRRALLSSALASSAVAGIALLTGCEGNDDGLVRGDGGATTATPDGAPTTAPGDAGHDAASVASDIQVLNSLLATEYGAIDAYAASAPLIQTPATSDPLASLAPVLLAIALSFHDQHVAHAEALRAAVVALGGTALATSAVSFVAPAGFTPSIANVLKLACNAERAAAISYVGAVAQISTTTNRFLAASIEGDETQHFMVLYAVLNGLVDPGPNLGTLTASELVPSQFVAAVALGTSLDEIAPFDVTT